MSQHVRQRHNVIYVWGWGSNGMLEQIGPKDFTYSFYVFIKQSNNDVTLLTSIDVTLNDVTLNDVTFNDVTFNDVTLNDVPRLSPVWRGPASVVYEEVADVTVTLVLYPGYGSVATVTDPAVETLRPVLWYPRVWRSCYPFRVLGLSHRCIVGNHRQKQHHSIN